MYKWTGKIDADCNYSLWPGRLKVDCTKQYRSFSLYSGTRPHVSAIMICGSLFLRWWRVSSFVLVMFSHVKDGVEAVVPVVSTCEVEVTWTYLQFFNVWHSTAAETAAVTHSWCRQHFGKHCFSALCLTSGDRTLPFLFLSPAPLCKKPAYCFLHGSTLSWPSLRLFPSPQIYTDFPHQLNAGVNQVI